MTMIVESANDGLTPQEREKRCSLRKRKPYIAKKLANISAMEARGEISPIIRLEKSYLCNFQCTHCSAEYYMDRHKQKVFKIEDARRKIDLDDVRELSRQADELGLGRFVITGGEPLVMRDFDAVVEAIDPEKHYIITDTNGWFLDDKRARHLKSIGVEKVQLSLDSMVESGHDTFRNKPGSYKRVMRAIDASLNAGLNLILSTVLIKGRAKTDEFREMCRYCTDRSIGLYVSYAKPTGSCSDHPEFVIEKEDADIMRELEKEYNVFTHMTPSYGSFKGCITMKGIITVTSAGEVTPCPYIDFSLGNLYETPLKEILDRGMRNPWIGPYRPDCLIGEDTQFIDLHAQKTQGVTLLPVLWGEGFSDHDSLVESDVVETDLKGFFDEHGRCIPDNVRAPAHRKARRHFTLKQPDIEYARIYERTKKSLNMGETMSATEFEARAENILAKISCHSSCENILKGVHIPFLIGRNVMSDIGEEFQDNWIPAVADSFQQFFPERTFTNHVQHALTGQLNIVPGSRYDQLLDAMGKKDVVGYYFPCLTEYSLPAALERMGTLPDNFILAGAFDTAAALIGSPDLLLRQDGYPPLLWLSALAGENPDIAYHFEAYGYNLTFNRRRHAGKAAESWASGLVMLG